MSAAIRIVITETNNLVEVEETEIRVAVEETQIVVNIGEAGGGGTDDVVTVDDDGLAPAMGDATWGFGLVNDGEEPAWLQIIDVSTDDDIVVTLAASGGSDVATADRPAKLRPGTYADGYATLQAAIDAIPKNIKRATINIEEGAAYVGAIVRGFQGGSLDIVGVWKDATLTTGAQSGAAGSGSGSTVLNKPTAAANWTANELIGKIVRVTSGAGYFGDDAFEENYARVKSNSTTQAVLEFSLPGLAAGDGFEIVEEGSVFTTEAVEEFSDNVTAILGFSNCTADIRIRRVRVDNTAASALYGLVSGQTQLVDVAGCGFTAAIVLPAYSSNLRALSVHLDAGSYFYAYGQNVIFVNGVVAEDSTVQFERFESLSASNVWVDGDVGYWNGIAIAHGGVATLGGGISNCLSAPPLLLENVREFSVSGSLVGTNAAQTYGARILGGGQYNISGMTLAGNDASKVVRVEDAYNLSYAQITGNGCHQIRGTFIIGGGVATNVFLDDVQVISGQMYLYGVIRPLGNAYKEITAHSGGGQSLATTVGYVGTKVVTAAADHDSARLLGSGDLTITGGLRGHVINATAYIVDLYPPSGRKIYLGGVDQGLNTAIEIQPGDWLDYVSDDTGNYWVK